MNEIYHFYGFHILYLFKVKAINDNLSNVFYFNNFKHYIHLGRKLLANGFSKILGTFLKLFSIKKIFYVYLSRTL